ncbi:polysaccharide pyruvyl transferase family protein [Acetobacteraceae bacterium H6797]|nr:polysaccharide pyruvyl transferase family protein [Acetobacteraceae bacterium H6797]
MSYTIPILGYYGHNNAGDEAFRLAFSSALSNRPHRFVKSFEPGVSVPAAVFGGGAIFNHYFVRHLTQVENIYAMGCSLPYGAGDIKLMDPLKDRLRCLYLRSKRDVEVAREAGYEAEFTPDIVFSLSPTSQMTLDKLISLAILPPIGFSRERRKLFVFLSHDYWVRYGKDNIKRFEKIHMLKERLAKVLDVAVNTYDVIIPSLSVWHSARDYVFAADVLKLMHHRERVCLIERYVEPADLISVMSRTQGAVVSMKYHGLVFGMMNGMLAINLGSTRKTVDLMADAGLSDLTYEGHQHSDKLLDLLQRDRDAALQSKIAGVAAEWKAEAKACLGRMAKQVLADTSAITAV